MLFNNWHSNKAVEHWLTCSDTPEKGNGTHRMNLATSKFTHQLWTKRWALGQRWQSRQCCPRRPRPRMPARGKTVGCSPRKIVEHSLKERLVNLSSRLYHEAPKNMKPKNRWNRPICPPVWSSFGITLHWGTAGIFNSCFRSHGEVNINVDRLVSHYPVACQLHARPAERSDTSVPSSVRLDADRQKGVSAVQIPANLHLT